MLRQQGTHAAAMVTIPGYLIRSLKGGATHLRRLEWLCDSVIELESFAGTSLVVKTFGCTVLTLNVSESQAHQVYKPSFQLIPVSYIFIVFQHLIHSSPLPLNYRF